MKYKKQHQLPPCKVCRAPASGFHYGANTCEPCKTFFRRTLAPGYIIKSCTKGGGCLENCKATGKITCAGCRYTQCARVGMRKQACKKGRYTLQKKLNDMKEIAESVLNYKNGEVITYEESELSIGSIVYKNFVSRLSYVHFMRQMLPLLKERMNQYLQTRRIETVSSVMLIPSQELPTAKYCESCPVQLNPNNDILIQAFRDANSVVNLWLGLAADLENYVKSFATFAKMVPGFRELHMDDKLILVKTVIFEQFTVTHIDCYDYNLNVRMLFDHSTSDLYLVPLNILSLGFADAEYSDMNKRCQKLIGQLNLSLKELSLMVVILLLSPDRAGLRDRRSVERLQAQYINTLRSTLHHNQASNNSRFQKCLLLLPELRECGMRHCKSATYKLRELNIIDQLSPLVLSVLQAEPF